MPVEMSAAQARRLGIDTTGAAGPVAPRAPRGTVTAAGPQLSTCTTCGETFTGEAAPTRHNRDTHHGRYAAPIT